jgi:hypothetical protein
MTTGENGRALRGRFSCTINRAAAPVFKNAENNEYQKSAPKRKQNKKSFVNLILIPK